MRLGIDFGTCFSFTATCIGDDRMPVPLVSSNPSIIDFNYGIPTVFYRDETLGEIFGKKAAELMAQHPANGVEYIKKKLREMDITATWQFGEREYTVREIVIKLLKFLISEAVNTYRHTYSREYHKNQSLEKLVLAIPVLNGTEVGDQYKEFILGCALEASQLSKNQIELIEEPIAVAKGFFSMNKELTIRDGSVVLIFDLGGGTCDIAVIEYNREPRVLAKNDVNIGGTDWDEQLYRYILENNPKTDISANDQYHFMKNVIAAKVNLSVAETTDFAHITSSGDIYSKRNLTRGEFERETQDYLEMTMTLVKDTLQQCPEAIALRDIETIILAGGASKMPMVEERLRKEFPQAEIYKPDAPDRAVALGAAVIAGPTRPVKWTAPNEKRQPKIEHKNTEANKPDVPARALFLDIEDKIGAAKPLSSASHETKQTSPKSADKDTTPVSDAVDGIAKKPKQTRKKMLAILSAFLCVAVVCGVFYIYNHRPKDILLFPELRGYSFQLEGVESDYNTPKEVLRNALTFPNHEDMIVGTVGLKEGGRVIHSYNLFGVNIIYANIVVNDQKLCSGKRKMLFVLERRAGDVQTIELVEKRNISLKYNNGEPVAYKLFTYDFSPADVYVLTIYVDGYVLSSAHLYSSREEE